MAALRREAPELAGDISHARLIVDFRNILTHDYAAIDDETVYELARADLPELRRECEILLSRADQ